MTAERVLSPREQEQLIVIANNVRHVRDQVDEKWPEVVQASALAKDCFDALMKDGFSSEHALSLVGPLMNYLKR